MGPFKGELPVFARLSPVSAAVACTNTPSHSRRPGNIRVRVRVSFTTGAVRSAILATAGLLVFLLLSSGIVVLQLLLSLMAYNSTIGPVDLRPLLSFSLINI